jgi:hypothetical protein
VLILLRAANLALQGRVKARHWFSIYCRTMAIGAAPHEAAKYLWSPACSACRAVDAASRIGRSHFVCTSCGAMSKYILTIDISPTGGPPGMAFESSRITGRKQEEDARKSGSSALQGRR